MKVQLEKSFVLPAPVEAAWALLQDVEAVAGCMPGARITERVDETHYKGTLTLKLGPASLSFRGEVEVKELDAGTRSLHMVGRGTDSTGTSGAAMDLHARVEPVDASSSRLFGTSEVSVSGKAAAFGGRLMQGVADQVLQQFVANFSQRLPAATPATDDPAAAGGADAAAAADSSETSETAPAAAQPKPAARELNGLALAWAVVRDWFQHLFAARRA
jgi:carbon monoxide dehydrogenase subunit G